MLGLFSLFVWLNFNTSRRQYIEKGAEGWCGGLREGFPLAWWDAGIETRCVIRDDTVYLDSRPYGGWQYLGVGCGVAFFALSLAATALVCESAIRKLQPRNEQFDLNAMNHRANRGVAIRPVTALASIVVLAGIVLANLTMTTEPKDTGNASAGFTQTMGWPFMTFLASEPQLRGMETEGRPAAEIVRYLESHPTTWWRHVHWFGSGIVMNSAACLLLVVGAACACEWILRREAQLRKLRLSENVAPIAAEKFS